MDTTTSNRDIIFYRHTESVTRRESHHYVKRDTRGGESICRLSHFIYRRLLNLNLQTCSCAPPALRGRGKGKGSRYVNYFRTHRRCDKYRLYVFTSSLISALIAYLTDAGGRGRHSRIFARMRDKQRTTKARWTTKQRFSGTNSCPLPSHRTRSPSLTLSLVNAAAKVITANYHRGDG